MSENGGMVAASYLTPAATFKSLGLEHIVLARHL
jgi:hypothetical protein